jgi:nucleoside-diphosphate-sugar epimerase
MNFLVTGGAGFIGSHVCERLLHDGHAVWAFDDLNDFGVLGRVIPRGEPNRLNSSTAICAIAPRSTNCLAA